MAEFSIAYPIDYTASGDTTAQAISKLINEISAIYSNLHRIRTFDIGAAEPSGPEAGHIWLDSTGGVLTAKVYDGSDFIVIPEITIASTPPSDPANYDVFIDTSTTPYQLNLYIVDDTSTTRYQYCEASTSVGDLKIPKADSDGLLAHDWTTNGNPIDGDSLTSDYELKVGERVKYSLSSSNSKMLHIAVPSDGAVYRFFFAGKNPASYDARANLYPNNNSSGNVLEPFLYCDGGSNGVAGQARTDGFRLLYSPPGVAIVDVWAKNGAGASITLTGASRTADYHGFYGFSGIRTDTSDWTSLGTISFEQNVTMDLIIERIM